MPRGYGDGDASELTLVLALGGVAHPPGYPLFVLLGHVWVQLLHAFGVGWAAAANSFSGLGAGVAVGLFHALAARLAPESLTARARGLLALVPTALLAFHPVWLREAVVAEVNSWHVAIVCALCLEALACLRAIELPAGADGDPLRRHALLWGLLCGAGLVHHPTSLAFSAPLSLAILLVLVRARRWRGRYAGAFALGLSLPLASLGFVAWRAFHPASFQWPLLRPNAASLLAHFRASAFGGYVGGFAPSPEQARLLATSIYPLLVPGLALLALAALRERGAVRRAAFVALLAAAALQLAFAFRYAVADPVVSFLPPLLVALLAIPAFGRELALRLRDPVLAAPLAAGLALTALLWVEDSSAEREQMARADATIRERWEAIPDGPAIVLWWSDYYTRLRAYQILEGEKPIVYVENPVMLSWLPPRRDFARRFGFDPLAGIELTDEGKLPLVAPNIARQTDLPVIVLDSAAGLHDEAAATSLPRLAVN